MKVHDTPLRRGAHERAAHVSELASIGSGVHDGGAADGTRDSAGELIARQTGSTCGLGHLSIRRTGLHRHAGAFHNDARKALGEAHDHFRQARIGHKQVAAQTQQAHRLASAMARGKNIGCLLNAGRLDHHGSRAADLKRGQPAHGHIPAHRLSPNDFPQRFQQNLVHHMDHDSLPDNNAWDSRSPRSINSCRLCTPHFP